MALILSVGVVLFVGIISKALKPPHGDEDPAGDGRRHCSP
jgi:hypothetical protein